MSESGTLFDNGPPRDGLHLVPVESGFHLSVWAKPRARKAAIQGLREGALIVAVTEVPENQKASQAIGRLLSKSLGIAASSVTLVSGPTHQRKVYHLKTKQKDAEVRRLLLP